MNLPDREIFQKLKGRHHDVLSVQKIIDYDHALDAYFKIDTSLEKNSQLEEDSFYTNLNAIDQEALNTSYFDFFQILEAIPKKSTIVDIGSSYSRLNLLNDYLELDHKVINIEVVEERLKAAKDYCRPHHEFLALDILNPKFKLPIADYYFLYIPTGKILEKVLTDLVEIAKNKTIHIIAIESHGNLIDLLWMNEAWLSEMPLKLKTSLPRHKSEIYFFESRAPAEIKEFIQILKEDKKELTLASETLYLALSYFKDKNYKAIAQIKTIGKEAKLKSFELKESEFYISDEGKLFLETKYPPRLLRFSGDDEVITSIKK